MFSRISTISLSDQSQAVITTIASIKRRPKPDSVNHLSVGTEGDIAKREEELKKLQSLKLTPQHLEPYLLSIEDMLQWGYVVEIPPGEGGERPSEEGSITTCDRCKEPFMVKRKEEADECVFHWGKPFTSKANGSSPFFARISCQLTCIALSRLFSRREATRLHMLCEDNRRGTVFERTARILREGPSRFAPATRVLSYSTSRLGFCERRKLVIFST